MANDERHRNDGWRTPPERCQEGELWRQNRRIEALERQVQELSQQLTEVLRIRNQDVDTQFAKILSKEIRLPTYSGDLMANAGEFLFNLEQYIVLKRIPDIFQPRIIAEALKGRAKVWFGAVKNQVENLEDFMERFRAEFMSEEVQERAKDAWKSKRYTNGNVLDFYYDRVGEASCFDPPLSQYTINKTVIGQLPADIQFSLAGINLNNTDSVVRALARVDETRLKLNGGDIYKTSWRDKSSNSNFNKSNDVTKNENNKNSDARAMQYTGGYRNYSNTPRDFSNNRNGGSNSNNQNWRDKGDNRGKNVANIDVVNTLDSAEINSQDNEISEVFNLNAFTGNGDPARVE